MKNSFDIAYLQSLPTRKFFLDFFEAEDFLIPEKILQAFKVAILKPKSEIALILKDISTKENLFSFVNNTKIINEIKRQDIADEKTEIFFKNGSHIAVYRRKDGL